MKIKMVISKNGFTLVELLVIIGIVGILFAGIIVGINPVSQIQKGRDATRKSDLRQIQSALELFRSDNNSYPVATTLYSSGCSSSFASATTTYMQKVPCDPTSNTIYNYDPSPGGCTETGPTYCTTYTLYGCLENKNDREREADDGVPADRCLIPGAAHERVGYTLFNP